MKIICQSCQSKYNVADEKVQGKVVKIRCRKCGATIVVDGTGAGSGSVAGGKTSSATGPIATVGARTSAMGGQGEAAGPWHVNVAEDDQRTMALSELAKAYGDGIVTLDTFIWTEGMDDWKPLGEVDAVASSLGGSSLGAHLSNGSARDTFEHDVGDAGGARAIPALPRFDSDDPNDGSDATRVYDMASVAGGEVGTGALAKGDAPPRGTSGEPKSAEPKRAAVVKREARARDLFASRVSADEARPDAQTSASIFQPSTGAGVGQLGGAPAESMDDAANKRTGERNENSVLFSLAVLTKGAEERAPAGIDEGTDDSGLIDLKALAAKTDSMRPPATMADASVFSQPLGAMQPLGAPVGVMASPLGEIHPKSRLPMWIGGGALVALLLVAGIAIGVKIAEGTTTAAASSAPSAAAPSDTTSAPVDTAGPSAVAASASASAAPSPSASSVAAAAKPKPTGSAAAGGAAYHAPAPKATSNGASAPAADTPAAATTTAPPKKAGGDCGCNGDLMCLMKCSTH